MSDLGILFLLALLVVCPLAMFWLMRSGHGSGEGESHEPEREPPVRTLTPLRPEEWREAGQRERETKQPPAGTDGRPRG